MRQTSKLARFLASEICSAWTQDSFEMGDNEALAEVIHTSLQNGRSQFAIAKLLAVVEKAIECYDDGDSIGEDTARAWDTLLEADIRTLAGAARADLGGSILDDLRHAIYVYDCGASRRHSEVMKAKTTECFRQIEAAHRAELATVQDLFFEATKDYNRKDNCRLTGIDFIRSFADRGITK